MKTSSYSAKRKLGLVPHYYNPTSREYQLGAWKNWPERWTESQRYDLALKQTQPRETWHRFTEHPIIIWQKEQRHLDHKRGSQF